MTLDVERVLAQLEALIEATPLPRLEAEPDELIESFAAMMPIRTPLITALADTATGVEADTRIRKRCQDLALRDQAWGDALGRARNVVGDRLTAVRRARAYR